MGATLDLILSVEEARRAQRMSQATVARALVVTQGHYSKVTSRQVPLSDKLAGRMEVWLGESVNAPVGDAAARRIHELAASIRKECMELMHLVGMVDIPDQASADRV